MIARVLVVAALLVLVGVPLLIRPSESTPDGPVRSLIVVTPHNEQIRAEFAGAFEAWCETELGEQVRVVYNAPGGTSEIRRMLQSQYTSDLRDDRPIGGTADLVWGGGSYEFGELSRAITLPGSDRSVTVLAPIEFSQADLDAAYGANRVGDGLLYDPDGRWFGTALSGFGIVFNHDVLDRLGVPDPERWEDLTDPRLDTWVALVNPGQSGSITTAFEAVLQRRGWREGWAILRRAAANSRYFSASSSKVPVDVSLGDAAAGICIDFYGRYQAQSIRDAGGGARVGYVDPEGETQIDADPIGVLAGAPEPELARHFIEFILSVPGQSLWQLPPDQPDGLGPREFSLRRMPIRRDVYESPLFDRFLDRVDPYRIASAVEDPEPAMRSFIAPVFAAMAIDNHHALRDAWRAIIAHPAYPDPATHRGVVMAEDVNDPELRSMLERFDAMPPVETPDGPRSLGDRENLAMLKAGWLRGGWDDLGLWPEQAAPADELRRRFERFFRQQYREIAR